MGDHGGRFQSLGDQAVSVLRDVNVRAVLNAKPCYSIETVLYNVLQLQLLLLLLKLEYAVHAESRRSC